MSTTGPKVVTSGTSGGSPLDRLSESTGGAAGRLGIFILLMVVGLGIPLVYMVWAMSSRVEAKEEVVLSRETYSGDKLAAAAPRTPPRPEPTERRTPQATPAAPPLPPAPPAPPRQDEPKGTDWDFVRARSGGPLVVVAAEKPDRAGRGAGAAGSTKARLRHVPRGTVLPAFLESKVVSDNLDSRARAVLTEDFELSGDVILPAGGWFIGNVAVLGSRYQKRVAVRVTNFVYPDGEREVQVSGLLLNPDESAHLLADDIDHHTGKLIAGIAGLELLRAASGALGGYQGNQVAVNFGAGVGDSTAGVFEPTLQNMTQIVPTITVDPGKPVYVFVEESFDVPEYEALPRGFVGGAPAEDSKDGASSSESDERLEAALARLEKTMDSVDALSRLPHGQQGGLP